MYSRISAVCLVQGRDVSFCCMLFTTDLSGSFLVPGKDFGWCASYSRPEGDNCRVLRTAVQSARHLDVNHCQPAHRVHPKVVQARIGETYTRDIWPRHEASVNLWPRRGAPVNLWPRHEASVNLWPRHEAAVHFCLSHVRFNPSLGFRVEGLGTYFVACSVQPNECLLRLLTDLIA